MFLNKNKLNPPEAQSSSGQFLGSFPQKDFPLENLSVHSMKQDLEILKNPEKANSQENTNSLSSSGFSFSEPPASFPNDSQEEPSPFLSASHQNENALEPPSYQEKASQEEGSELPFEETSTSQPDQSGARKFLIFLVIFLSLVALGVGSYYYWLVKRGSTEVATETEEAESIPSQSEGPFISENSQKTTEPEKLQENIITLDIENFSKLQLKESLKSQVNNLSKSQTEKVSEFKLKDLKGNLIPLGVLAEKFQIKFVKNSQAYFADSYSFFTFKEGLETGTGLVLELKDPEVLSKKMREVEPYLVVDLDFMLLETFKKPLKNSFAQSAYKNGLIRYLNLISPEKLSVDYVLLKNNLIIGTTKNTSRALYDFVESKNSL